MAKIYGLNGYLRGKQGNNVFSVQGGVQVVKAYQPVVSNPKSIAQREQRSKMSLAGKMSKIVPSSAILGISDGNARARRAAFVRNIIKNSVVSGSASSLTASIAYEKIMFSVGSLLHQSQIASVTAVWVGQDPRSNVRVTLPQMTFGYNPPAGYSELAVVCLFDANTSLLDSCKVVTRSTTGSQVVDFPYRTRSDVFVAVYCVPSVPASSLGSGRSSELGATDTDVLVNAVANSYAAGLVYGNSVLLGMVPVLGAQTSIHNTPAEDDMREVVEEALTETAVAETKSKK